MKYLPRILLLRLPGALAPRPYKYLQASVKLTQAAHLFYYQIADRVIKKYAISEVVRKQAASNRQSSTLKAIAEYAICKSAIALYSLAGSSKNSPWLPLD